MKASRVVAVLLVLAVVALLSVTEFLRSDVAHATITTTDHINSNNNNISAFVSPVPKPLPSGSETSPNNHVNIHSNRNHNNNNITNGLQQPPPLVASRDLSTVVISYAYQGGMRTLAEHFFHGKMCDYIRNGTTMEEYATRSTLVNISFDCFDLFRNGEYGTGNYITAFYGVRMAAHAMGHTDVIIQCRDADEHKRDLVLPWMVGVFPRLSHDGTAPQQTPLLQQQQQQQQQQHQPTDQPNATEACRDYTVCPIGYRWRDIVFEMRRMAIAMVGIPHIDHPSASWAESNLWSAADSESHYHGQDYYQLPHPTKGGPVLYPNTELDDAVLHFRCGDIIVSNHPSFGFMKFRSFSRHISPAVRTIGVVTQPFDETAQNRMAEGGHLKRERCRMVVYAFVEHLQKHFPRAKVTIRNDATETIALTFARMIMANQTVIGMTSFGVFPGVATFGTAFIRNPDFRKAPNRWLHTSPILSKLDNVKLIDEPRLMAPQVKRMWGTDGAAVMEWFHTYELEDNSSIVENTQTNLISTNNVSTTNESGLDHVDDDDNNNNNIDGVIVPNPEPTSLPQIIVTEGSSERMGTSPSILSNGNGTKTPDDNATLSASSVDPISFQESTLGDGINTLTTHILQPLLNETVTSPELGPDGSPYHHFLPIDPKNTIVVDYHDRSGMHALAKEFFDGGICRSIQQGRSPEVFEQSSTLVNITFGCLDLFQYSGLGTGNFISAFYGWRMAAHTLGRTDVVIYCFDAEEQKKDLILPWMIGAFPRLPQGDPEIDDQPPQNSACSDYKTIPIGYRWRDMIFELRRMAIALVGIPSPDHPSAIWADSILWSNEVEGHRHGRDYYQLAHPKKGEIPLFPNFELDDAVLHFRCGDIIASNHPSFGFMKFGSFSRHISPDVRSIGVVTQPFDAAAQQRGAEGGQFKRDRCKLVVGAFVEHLQEKFPAARVSIHNNVNETIALTFARMIMANQTVVAITSFGVFPGVATFGTGYIRKPDFIKAPNRWLLTSPLVERVNNVKLIEEPKLLAPQIKNMWGANGSAVLDWFRNYD